MCKILLVIVVLFCGWLTFRYMDAVTRIEAGVINEIRLVHDREFLIQLPTLWRQARTKETLAKLMREKYPNVLVQEVEEDLCWGALRLKFASPTDLLSVTEGCN